jgi:hypothetical protein
MKLEFFRQIFEKYLNAKFSKIFPEGAEFFHEDGRKAMTKLLVAFRKFEKRPKN